MVNLLKYCLKLLAISIILFSCGSEQDWYQRNLDSTEKTLWADRMFNGSGKYYQGSVPEQFLLMEARQLDPLNSKIVREQGVAWLKRGFGIEMQQFYQQAVAIDPHSWQGMRGYNYLYFYRDYERAIADFNATDTLTEGTDYPQGQSVDYMRGLCYLGLRQYDQAIDYFSKYIDEVTAEDGENWVDVYAFLYRGITYKEMGESRLAISDFKKGIKYYKNLADLYFHLAELEYEQGNMQEASTLIQKADEHYTNGYYHQRPYVTVQYQLHHEMIADLKNRINTSN